MIYVSLLVLILLVSLLGIRQSAVPKYQDAYDSVLTFNATRLVNSPIIHTDIHPRLQEEEARIGYPNMNSPTLFLVPEWVENPLGKYYLYFAHHKGSYLRLAYADTLRGPWQLYDGEILPLDKSGLTTHQLRDPDVFQDEDGELHLLFTGAGEQVIEIAKLEKKSQVDI